ncbi:dihydrolipoyl dehydrogenase [Methylobacterium radiotolerans]|uniref:Dihydrolipoyl dehydrogenase n=1 Tax=Methylobacterium radiotolerans (strain ATCC 27329 / DSM 1819 / JCM 2831 / NBRC 15690 / NCIMB 10815 / 0-1) TaxID=426355 RepID=B1M0N4_METRJ|nr:dihydrolipoyl dehydrogenase [Methylobacterium radiotolerans]ACB27556.1 dihydrolipoamide dehydrogenase [Methylobacterium radiotolerans JCM 2831]GEM99119.1 dihydrolipoyl dehydrogenase [Methylobacterium radiotolerans]
MPETFDIRVPDLGDYADVPVIEIPVAPGQPVDKDQTLLVVESDKATLDIPSPAAGRLVEMLVGLGDTVSAGTLVARLAVEAPGARAEPLTAPVPAPRPAAPPPEPRAEAGCDLLVIGGGPGGYSAAFRAADLGQRVVLVERHATLGGVCLNVGCIPSKALLHVAAVTEEAVRLAAHGISFGAPTVDLEKLRTFKAGTVRRLTDGLAQMARQRKVEVVRGTARFIGPDTVSVTLHDGGTRDITFTGAVVAAGSAPVALPMLPDDPRIVNSTGALELPAVPRRLLVIGGGIIGLEMATVYSALGARVDVVERLPGLLEGVDRDLVGVWTKRNAHRFDRVLTGVEVVSAEARPDGIAVTFSGEAEPGTYDLVLQAAGRRPNGATLGLDAAGVALDGGFVPVDAQMRTNVPHIFAIGDCVGQPMLAHKAVHQGHVAAEAAAGHKAGFDAAVIPSVAYTDPEIAWAGLTETAAKAAGRAVEVARFPWAASGRAIANGADYGLTKLLFDAQTGRVVGGAIVGPSAGDMIGEVALAIEMGADATDIGRTIHPHPTLGETIGLAAEAGLGLCTDLPPLARR